MNDNGNIDRLCRGALAPPLGGQITPVLEYILEIIIFYKNCKDVGMA